MFKSLIKEYRQLPLIQEGQKILISRCLFNIFLGGIFSLIPPLLIKFLFESHAIYENITSIMYWLLISLVLIGCIHLFNFYYVAFYSDKIITYISSNLRLYQVDLFYQLSKSQREKLDDGLLFNSLYAETGVIAAGYINFLSLFIYISQIVIYLCVLWYFSLPFALLSVLCLLLYGFSIFFNTNRFQDTIIQETFAQDKLTSKISNIINSHKESKIFANSRYLSDIIKKYIFQWQEKRITYNFWYTLIQSIPAFLTSSSPTIIYGVGMILVLLGKSTIIYGVGMILVLLGKSTIGMILFVVQFISLLFASMNNLASVVIEQKNVYPYINRFKSISNELSNQEDSSHFEKSSITADQRSLEIKHHSVYRNNQHVLTVSNLLIEESGIYLLQGENGSGKSSLLDDIYFSPESHDQKIGYFTSSSLFIEDDIEQNILFGKIAYDLDYLQSIYSVLDITFLNANVNKLSLGQRQKVMLARFFINHKDKPIWFIDEPFVNLDIASIEALKRLLIDESVNRIIIMITHDVSLEGEAKKIYRIASKRCEIL
ncbi:ABC transporter ATP-binding protein [Vagococcus sp. BWB3-3]|uniref:ABC transporter ATP-binding protein n=1 Tax=Vagococcus allomyrinae TaxID=2794353 RepID=A0A940PEF2_9ENTE|nr:ABC transporter ATP-binding protein [Vagococcus allomyrinae]MBP1042468.1 ABC transporter ATP-binding protein [Vagococcus allomyrinae]